MVDTVTAASPTKPLRQPTVAAIQASGVAAASQALRAATDARLEGWVDSAVPPPPGFYSAAADPSLGAEWWHDKLELPKAWDKATGKGVTLADVGKSLSDLK